MRSEAVKPPAAGWSRRLARQTQRFSPSKNHPTSAIAGSRGSSSYCAAVMVTTISVHSGASVALGLALAADP
jgi:hypothetical protein